MLRLATAPAAGAAADGLHQQCRAGAPHHRAQGGIVADPLLCAQNRPSQIEVGEATITGDTASVTVQTIWARGPDTNATRELQVELVYNEGQWQGQWRINDVRCTANE